MLISYLLPSDLIYCSFGGQTPLVDSGDGVSPDSGERTWSGGIKVTVGFMCVREIAWAHLVPADEP